MKQPEIFVEFLAVGYISSGNYSFIILLTMELLPSESCMK